MNSLKFKNKLVVVVFILAFLSTELSFGQEDAKIENSYNTWIGFNLKHKFTDKLKWNFNPEVRLKDINTPYKYLVETGLEYEIWKPFSFGASYRFEIKPDDNSFEYNNRYAFDLNHESKFNRFETKLRWRYSNFSDFDNEDSEDIFRYKADLSYNIRKSKITPSISMEAFQSLNGNGFEKMRYSAGADFKLFKRNTIGLDYKLDYYLQELKNKHIVSINYKLKF